jgi:hypothetical protein
MKLKDISRAADNVSRYGNKFGLPHRFWSKVDKRGDDECWNWKGSLRTTGYGQLTIRVDGKTRSKSAPQIAYLLQHGSIDETLDVCHTCDNRKCVNPAHLYQGTRHDNNMDSVSRGRWNNQKRISRAKLSEHDVATIIARDIFGERHNFLAVEHDVSTRSIGDIANYHTWKHLKF